MLLATDGDATTATSSTSPPTVRATGREPSSPARPADHAADVEAVRRDLAAWDGDLVGWLDAIGRPGVGRCRPVSAPFAHASEAEMSRILDFYAVRWEYEPHTFPILWNLDGDVVESFSPDFYLPDLDLYLEMTTLRQKLVRKKNRKLRRLRELYPDLNIKLFYARDFRALMLKYGKLALADGLSGTSGPGRAPVRRARAGRSTPTMRRPCRAVGAVARDRPSATTAGRVRRRRAARRAPAAGRDHGTGRRRMSETAEPPRRRRRDPPDRGRDRGQGARARRPDQRRLRRPPADARVGAQGLAAVHGRPDAGDRHPGPDRPDGGQLVRRHRRPNRPASCGSSRTSRRASPTRTC